MDRLGVGAGATPGEDEAHRELAGIGGRCREAPLPTPANAPVDPASHLSRAELASHLKLSPRSVDRFISRHRLKSGSGRPVLVRLERYAWCLVGLRRQSTRSMAPAPAVRGDRTPPPPIQPGEELLLVARSDGFEGSEDALRSIAPGCRVRTLDECPEGHWGWSLHRAAKAMVGVHEAMARGRARPQSEADSNASRYLRQLLREASTAKALDAPALSRSLRQLPAGERHLLLEALSDEVVDAARTSSPVPLEYAREPLLTERELANEVRRTIATVRRWRVEGSGPVFLRIERAVRYSRVDLDAWMGERLVR